MVEDQSRKSQKKRESTACLVTQMSLSRNILFEEEGRTQLSNQWIKDEISTLVQLSHINMFNNDNVLFFFSLIFNCFLSEEEKKN